MVSCIYNGGAISEITALKCGAKYPCITPLKYRPKNPRLYFSEIKPLGLIHIQSLVTRWVVGLYNLVPAAVIGKSCFVLVSREIGGLDTVWLVDLYLAVCPVCTVKSKGSSLTTSRSKLGPRSFLYNP